MWCKNCNKIVYGDICDTCGQPTTQDVPIEVYWCAHCHIPIMAEIKSVYKRLI